MKLPPKKVTYRGYGFLLKGLAILIGKDPTKNTPEGRLLMRLSKAMEQYEKEVLPPPFGKNKDG